MEKVSRVHLFAQLRKVLVILFGVLSIFVSPVWAKVLSNVSIDSSFGFNVSYPALNMVDGTYGSSNMGLADTNGAQVIFDLGLGGQTFNKVRITPPVYGGLESSTYNPTLGTLEFSDDKSTWSVAIPWCAPQLESTYVTDWSECAMPGVITARYVRFRYITLGRIGEFLFIDSPQLAVWELSQDQTYTNLYPAINTVDGDDSTLGVIANTPGIVYDLGDVRSVYGFDMQAGSSYTNPTGGNLYVSNFPDANFTLVGTWTLSSLEAGKWGTVNFGDANAVSGRYIKLDNYSQNCQWAEIDIISKISVNSDYGFSNSNYPASNMVDGAYGSSNMGMADTSGAWVIFDLGRRKSTFTKVRITPPMYGGSGSQTFNPTSGTMEFSDDLVNWTAPRNWSSPSLESINVTDWSESAMSSLVTAHYVRLKYLTLGRISEIQFLNNSQLAVWELGQDAYYTNNYPVINTVDNDAGTFGVDNDTNAVVYDMGYVAAVYGFKIQARSLDNLNPTSGILAVSNQPDTGFVSVGNWTLPNLAAGEWGTVDLDDANAVVGRYVKIDNSGGGQWAEIKLLTIRNDATIYGSYGFSSDYPAENMVDGAYGSANMGMADTSGAWVIFDLGSDAIPFRKVRITPPVYGGSGSETFNPTSGTMSFSEDLVMWTDSVAWSAPALESVGTIDWAEFAMPLPVKSHYVKFSYGTLGRISEFQFITEPQLAVWELSQDAYYTNNYPAINTADDDAVTQGVVPNSPGIVYDLGWFQDVYGFNMQACIWDDLNPTTGTLYVSDMPDSNFVSVGTWALSALDAGTWGTVDLGEANAVTGRYVKLTFTEQYGQWAEFEVLSTSSGLTLVNNGSANSAIVIPVPCPTVVQKAADELQSYIYKATGATLTIYTEPNKPGGYDGLIYLGRCNASIDAGINLDCISTVHNAFIIRRVDNDLFIAGTDEGGSSDNFAVDAGTLFGVYEFLGSELGVRWLWPGTIGEYVPQCSTITIGHCDTVFIPQLLHSWLRSASYSYSGWSDPNNRDYFINAQTEWMRRHQFNMAVSLQYPHGFMRTSETETYWDRYHTNHSDWFNLLPDDTREPDPYYENGNASGLIAHCVSSTGLQAQIVNNWIPDVASDTPWINGTENDTGGKCMCNSCMALDVEPADFLSEYGITWSQRASSATTAFDNEEAGWEYWLGPMSDRYSNFWLSLQNEATYAGYPDAKVVGLAYVNYRHPPVAKDGKLNDNIIVGYVPDFYFPWTTAERDAAKNDWNGWRNTGCSLFYRPNYILSGHNFPIYYADKLIEDFVYCYDRCMIATDFDSLTGQFAVQTPTLYVLARIHTYASNKNKSVAEITTELLDEFYDSFGPAEPNVRDYFGYMKTVSDNVSSYSAAFSSWYTDACDIFTPSVMSTARTKINAAIAAASGNSDATAKVTFLKEGLDLVELTLAAQSEWEDYMNTGDLVGWQDSVDALDANRALVEDDFVSNMAFLATYEGNVWDRDIRGHDITAGELWPMQGDKIQDQNGAAFGYQDCFEVLPYYGTDNLCHMLIDFGVATNVDKIKLVNRKDTTTNYSPKHVHIYVASDESSPSFKSHHPGSYTIKVYDGDFLPAIIEANATRECDINNFNRRYFLLEVVSNFWGDINTQTNYALYFADITASVDLFSDGFESNFDRWTDGGTTDWDRATSYKHSGSYSAHAGSADNDLISDNINTASYASMTITFWYRDDDIDADDDIYLQLYNGTGYISKFELDTVTEDTWYQYTVTIYNSGSDSQYFRSNFRIKFEGTSIDSGENLWIDDISIVAQY